MMALTAIWPGSYAQTRAATWPIQTSFFAERYFKLYGTSDCDSMLPGKPCMNRRMEPLSKNPIWWNI